MLVVVDVVAFVGGREQVAFGLSEEFRFVGSFEEVEFVFGVAGPQHQVVDEEFVVFVDSFCEKRKREGELIQMEKSEEEVKTFVKSLQNSKEIEKGQKM